MAIVERESEFARLNEALSKLDSGGALEIVSGAIATGKTELLRVFGRRAADSGVFVMTATGSQAEQDLPLGVISQLLHSVPMANTGLANTSAQLDQCMLDITMSDMDDQTVERRIAQQAHSVHAALLEAAASRPVVVCLDDVHLADSASIRCMLYLTRRLRTAPVLFVLSERDSAPDPTGSCYGDLLREPHCGRIRLSLLSRAGIAALVEEKFGATAPADLAEQCHTGSGGNPLLAGALLHDALSSGDTFHRAYLSCLRGCGHAAVRLATATAVLRPEQAALAGKLANFTTDEADRTRRALTAAGLVGEGDFHTPSARAAVLDELEPGARASLRYEAALLLHHVGAPLRDIAAQLASAGLFDITADKQWIVGILRQAAEDALADDDVDTATAYAEAAFCAAGTRDHVMLRMLLNKISLRTNPGACARYSIDLAATLTMQEKWSDPQNGEVHVAIRHLLTHDRVAEAVGLYNRVAETTDPTSIGAIDLRIAHNIVMNTHPVLLSQLRTLPTVRDLARAAMPGMAVDQSLTAAESLTALLRRGDPAKTAKVANYLLTNLRLADNTVSTAAEALQTLIYADRTQPAEEICGRLLAEARSRSALGWQAIFSQLQSEIAIRRGDLPAAARLAAAAMTGPMNLVPVWGGYIGAPLGVALTAATEMGEQPLADRILRHLIPESTFQNRYGLHYLHARGHHHLAAGRYFAAAEDFSVCGELLTAWNLDQPSLVPWRSALAEATLGLDDQKKAHALAREQLALLAPGQIRTHGLSLRVLAAATPLRERPPLLNKAAELLRASGDRLELARTLGALGDAYQQLGDAGRARTVVRRAWDLAKACGARLLCDALIPEQFPDVGELPEQDRASGMTKLTAAERRVVGLAMEGRTNSWIANKLYVSVSSVEQHLTRAYRKLNIHRREDLVTVLQTARSRSECDPV